jgi:hypothetical protein
MTEFREFVYAATNSFHDALSRAKEEMPFVPGVNLTDGYLDRFCIYNKRAREGANVTAADLRKLKDEPAVHDFMRDKVGEEFDPASVIFNNSGDIVEEGIGRASAEEIQQIVDFYRENTKDLDLDDMQDVACIISDDLYCILASKYTNADDIARRLLREITLPYMEEHYRSFMIECDGCKLNEEASELRDEIAVEMKRQILGLQQLSKSVTSQSTGRH